MTVYDLRRLLGVTLLAAACAGGVSACGGDDDKAPASIEDAKAKLSKDCQEGDASDKKLCDCIADELAKQGKSAEEIDAIRKEVNDKGNVPDEIKKIKTCGT